MKGRDVKFKGAQQATAFQKFLLFFIRPMWVSYAFSPGKLKVKLLGDTFFIVDDKTGRYGHS